MNVVRGSGSRGSSWMKDCCQHVVVVDGVVVNCDPTVMFDCSRGAREKCVPLTSVCDENDDCGDAADETPDLCANHSESSNTQLTKQRSGVCLSVCSFVCLCVCLCLSICPSVCVFLCPYFRSFVWLSVCLFVCLSIFSSVCQFVWLSLCVCLYLSICLSVQW